MYAQSRLKLYTKGRKQSDFAKGMVQRYGIEFLDFRFSTDEHIIITFPNHTVERSLLLRSLIRTPCPLIVDAFACIGADTMALMADFPRAQLFSVQRTFDEKEVERFERLTHNTQLFNNAFCGGCCAVVNVPLDIEGFLPNVRKRIDLLYLDPPWGDSAGASYTNQDVYDYAASVLALAQFPPRIVVMKLRPAIEAKPNGYELKRLIEIRAHKGNSALFCFYVFVIQSRKVIVIKTK